MQLATEVKYDSDVLGQIKHVFNRVSNLGGSIPDGLPLPLTWDVVREALKAEAATLMKDEKVGRVRTERILSAPLSLPSLWGSRLALADGPLPEHGVLG